MTIRLRLGRRQLAALPDIRLHQQVRTPKGSGSVERIYTAPCRHGEIYAVRLRNQLRPRIFYRAELQPLPLFSTRLETPTEEATL